MDHKRIFIASTGKNVGKTTVSLGLLAAFSKAFSHVGYIKPVGQQWVEAQGGLKVDKDIVLFKERFSIDTSYEQMSPVLLPKSFTRDYLDGKFNEEDLQKKIEQSFNAISKAKQITLIEGTGHIGVGSIINLNNAQVASALNAPLILVAPGGVGSSFDQIALNYGLCKMYGVKMVGVILNRVKADKLDMVKSYMQKALDRLGIPLLGCIPFNPLLSTPTLADFEALFKTKLLSGYQDRLHHFKTVRMIATSVDLFARTLNSDQLIITHVAREDVILASLERYHREKEAGNPFKLALILTGRSLRDPIAKEIQQADLPCLISSDKSFETMQKISSFTAKIARDDQEKIDEAIQVVGASIDFETLSQKL